MRFLASAGLVTILAGLGAYYTTNELSLFSIVNLIIGPLLLLIAAIVEVRRFRGFTGVAARRVALRWGLIGSGVLALCIVVNVLGLGWRSTIDLTVERRYTLSDQTLELCKQITAAPALARDGGQPQLLFLKDTLMARDVRLLIQAYASSCPGLEVREIRTADAPPEAQPILETVEATVLACRADRCEPAGFPSEENISNALLRLARQRQIQIHFMVGHGEANLASQGAHGFADLAAALREEGLRLEALVGPATREIPSDADVLVIAGAVRDLLPAELAGLQRYLESGGRLLVLLEPNVSTNLEALLQDWGFGLPVGVMADQASSPLLEDPMPVSLLLRSYNPFHPVTRKLSNRTMLLLPGTRPILPLRKPQPEDQLEALVFASRSAWLESDVVSALSDRSIEPDAEELTPRDLPIAAAGRYPRGEREARIVLIGDHDFASNRLLSALYNRDFILNAVLWLADDDEHIAIRPKAWTPDQDPLTLQQTLAYFYFLAFALPEILMLLGIHAWYRQRGS